MDTETGVLVEGPGNDSGGSVDKLKTWLVEVVLKNVAPKVSNALIAGGITFFIAHQEFMEQMGITYYPNFIGTWSGAVPSGRLLVIEIDTLGVWGGAMLIMGATAIWALFQHHAVATVTGAPQSGDKRIQPPVPVEGGQRQGDPK